MSDYWAPTTEQVRNGYRSPFDSPYAADEFDRWLAQERADAVAAAADAVERSFDHAYDEQNTSQVDPALGAFWHGEGYRHRDKQVRTVLEGLK